MIPINYIINKIILLIISFSIRLINYLQKKINFLSILENNYSRGNTFNFIQVGANDGKSFDCLYDFVIDRKVNGIVIEPIYEFYKELCKNYELNLGVIPLNFALHPSLNSASIFSVNPSRINNYPDWVKGIASFNRLHLIKHQIKENDIEARKVICVTLNQIITQYFNNINIHLVQIDTEGFDSEIIKMIDFDKYMPDVIKYEESHLEENDKLEIKKYLKEKKYHLINDRNDVIAVNLKVVKLY